MAGPGLGLVKSIQGRRRLGTLLDECSGSWQSAGPSGVLGLARPELNVPGSPPHYRFRFGVQRTGLGCSVRPGLDIRFASCG